MDLDILDLDIQAKYTENLPSQEESILPEKPDRFDRDTYRLINGVWSTKQPYGYCHYAGHKGYISKANYKTHKCGKHKCHYFEPNKTSMDIQQAFKTKAEYAAKADAEKRLREQFLDGAITLDAYNKGKEKIRRDYAKQKEIDELCYIQATMQE